MTNLIRGVVAGIFLATSAWAAQPTQQMDSYLNGDIRTWANDAAIVAAINAQNLRTAGIDQAEIDKQDTVWRADVIARAMSLVDSVVENPAADFLRSKVAQSGGTITEIFIMDAKGLNVAASAPTSDYWQGDEAKFTETFPRGEGAYYYSQLEYDESASAVHTQISLAITDPATGKVIGAMTVGVDVSRLP